MKKPDLQMLAQWLDPAIIVALEQRRRLNNEFKRRRKLDTLYILWLMLAVSLNTQQNSLHEILRLVTGQLAIKWTVSVAAFSKARAHFSPQRFILAIRQIGIAVAKSNSPKTSALARSATACCR
jgi:hypothetical protein